MVGQGRVEGWDLLRGVAMAFVLLVHALDAAGVTGHQGWGIIGLTSFFVLSGYLITGILIRDVGRHGRLRIWNFYQNRAVRLLPPLLVVIGAYVVVEVLVDRTRDPVLLTAVVGLAYLANLPGLRDLTGSLRQLWSLAFEEQFYLVWPTVFALAWKRRVTSRVVVVLIILSSLALLVTLAVSMERPERVYTLPTTWAAPTLIGCWAALERDRVRAWLRPHSRSRAGILLVSLAVLAWAAFSWEYTESLMYLGGPTIAGAACLVVVLSLEDWQRVEQPWLRPLVGLGTVSYAAYLWNYPVAMYAHEFLDGVAAQIAVTTTLSLALAIASWYLVEKPSQRWKARRATAAGTGRPGQPSRLPDPAS